MISMRTATTTTWTNHVLLVVLSLFVCWFGYVIESVHSEASASASASVTFSSSSSQLSSQSQPLVSFKCPDQFGYYADSSNCSKYFVCVFGEALHESCTGGLHFSSELQTCDWPRNVECVAAATAAIQDSKSQSNSNNNVRDDDSSHHSDALYDYGLDDINPIVGSNQNDDHNGRHIQNYDDNGGSYNIHGSDNGETSHNSSNSDSNLNNKNNDNGDDYTLDLQRSRTVARSNSHDRNFGTIGRSISGSRHQTPTSYGATYPDYSQPHLSDISADTNKSSPEINSNPYNNNNNNNNNDNEQPIKNNRVTNDDLNNPNFEEAISAIVDENGGIHLHDDPGSLFSLVSSSSQNSPEPDREHVNVFVKHITAEDLHNLNAEPTRSKPNNKILLVNQSHTVNHNQIPSRTRIVHRVSSQSRPQQAGQLPQPPIQSIEPHSLPAYFGSPFSLPQEPQRSPQERRPRQRIHIIVNHNHNNNNNNNNSRIFSVQPEESIDEEFDYKRIISGTSSTPRYLNQRPNIDYRRPAPISSTTTFTQKPTTSTTTPLPKITTERRAVQDNSYLTNNERRANSNTRLANIRQDYDPQPELVRPIQVPIKSSTLSLPHRPPAQYHTPEPFSLAVKCNDRSCRLPDCFCGGLEVPGALPVTQIPQIVLITFDDAINDINWHIFQEIFNTGRKNPNGCPIRGTFFVSHEWTDYGQVQTLYSEGHEMASHSITHSFGERFSKAQWFKEINGQRDILHNFGGVKLEDIRGMRAPFLQTGGNKQFEMLYEANFTYDSSMPIFENSPPFWPYTLDYAINHECMIAPCPTKSYPGLWEIGLIMWHDLRGGRCSMGDACSNPTDENGVYEMLMKNFNRHYKSNRAPFGLFYHSAWFNSEHHKSGFLTFIDEVLKNNDVYFVTSWQQLQWMREPTPLSRIHGFEHWKCQRKDVVDERPPPCHNPTVCNVGFKSGSRFFKTCQLCPESYPWVGNTGFGKKKDSLLS